MTLFRPLTRREMLALAGGSATLMGAPAILCGAAPDEPVATCAQGKLRGVADRGVLVFKGVPYAGSVSGPERRFRAPPSPVGWTGVRDATRLGPPSIQPRGTSFGFGEPDPAEDCLVLNIWTPALDGRKRAVMVYQHGGGYVIGSGGAPWQDGGRLAREHDVVVVQSNHRLGITGYLYLGQLLGAEYAGNQGLQDLVAALAWVNQNISAFGGDPGNVMIFGESGGGAKTACLFAMPSADAFFHRASIESALFDTRRAPEEATEVAREVMRRLAVTDPRDLLSVPAAALLRAQVGDGSGVPDGTIGAVNAPAFKPQIMFSPFVDGAVLPEEAFKSGAPGISARKALIVGGCKDEAVFFYQGDKSAFALSEAQMRERLALKLGNRTDAWISAFRKSRPEATPSELFIAITTAKPWRTVALKIAEFKAAQGKAPVYSYLLDYRSPALVPGTQFPEGSPHASDIAMKFNTALDFGAGPLNPGGKVDPGKIKTAMNMSTMWVNFAKYGKPSAPDQPEWQPYTLQNRETMIIRENCRLVSDPEAMERRFLATEYAADQM
jgi:para-nitrobenzyl esterase